MQPGTDDIWCIPRQEVLYKSYKISLDFRILLESHKTSLKFIFETLQSLLSRDPVCQVTFNIKKDLRLHLTRKHPSSGCYTNKSLPIVDSHIL